ncbi:hypothetical protein OPFAMLBM_00192 [Aeromonas phage avDM12-TAAL]|nr:hypothetical protein OPFAMLBM_00192 [Aeromonas phage avDM12-TAAL]
MIFEEVQIPETPAEKRNKKAWIDIGVRFLDAKKKNPSLTVKKFADDNGLKYETFGRAMRRYKDDIKEYYSAINPNKNKAQWVELGVAYLRAKEKGITISQFADDKNLNKETMSRAFRKFRDDIIIKKNLEDSMKNKSKLTAKQKYDLLKQDFNAQVKLRTRDSVQKNEKKSNEWFTDIIKKNVRGFRPNKPQIGKLYTYIYDAKHKDTLPYWDVYPLIVYLGPSLRYPGLMMGLNLHYIPPKARKDFLEELLKYASTDRITNKTSLKINWDKVKSMRGAEHMIKAYIPQRIKGGMIEIKPQDWVNAVFLPTQKFLSGGKPFGAQKVWKGY